MNIIDVKRITDAVAQLCIKANKRLPSDIEKRIKEAKCLECNALACSVLADLEKNIEAAL